jgi:DNA-binding response OmpR family regulator
MGKKVLVIDDEKATTFLVKTLLEREGLEVVTANTGEEGLELVRTEKPDLILLDVMMPGLDGWETLERIRQTKGGRSIPVSMFSVMSSPSDTMFGVKVEGVVDYITKPFNRADLVRRVKGILGEGGPG